MKSQAKLKNKTKREETEAENYLWRERKTEKCKLRGKKTKEKI